MVVRAHVMLNVSFCFVLPFEVQPAKQNCSGSVLCCCSAGAGSSSSSGGEETAGVLSCVVGEIDIAVATRTFVGFR